MGGEATPGLGTPKDEELLGRMSSDLALCRPDACAELLLPAALTPLVCISMLQSYRAF